MLYPLALIFGCWNSPFPDMLWLQHAPAALVWAGMIAAAGWGWISTLSVASISCFLLLHVIAARWIYSFVPYDEWAQFLTGHTVSDYFGWRRNHFDRLVHFMSGVLFVIPAMEVCQRLGGMKPRVSAIQSIAIVLAIGALYEIAEWQFAVFMSPAMAQAYNGQQGDIWDPQADMVLAGFGSLVTAFLFRDWRFAD